LKFYASPTGELLNDWST